MDINTPEIEFSKASAIFEPEEDTPKYLVTCNGAYLVWLLDSK